MKTKSDRNDLLRYLEQAVPNDLWPDYLNVIENNDPTVVKFKKLWEDKGFSLLGAAFDTYFLIEKEAKRTQDFLACL